MSNQHQQVILIRPMKFIKFLGSIVIFLVLANITVGIIRLMSGHDSIYGIIPLFNLFDEYNIPSFFSSIILLLVAGLLYLITIIKMKCVDPYRFHWAILTITFVFLSTDEILALHERLSQPIQKLTGLMRGSFEYWGWTLPYALLSLIFVLAFLKFFFHLPKKTQYLGFIAAAIYIIGTIGFEIIEGVYGALSFGIEFSTICSSPLYLVLVTIEETLEMTGVLISIYTLLDYMITELGGVRIEIG